MSQVVFRAVFALFRILRVGGSPNAGVVSSKPALESNSKLYFPVSQNDGKNPEINRFFVIISNLEYGVRRFLRSWSISTKIDGVILKLQKYNHNIYHSGDLKSHIFINLPY